MEDDPLGRAMDQAGCWLRWAALAIGVALVVGVMAWARACGGAG